VSALPQGIEEGDFERIEAAVRETERGRWFLDEFARRVRTAEGARMASALDRLEERAALRQAADDEARHQVRRVASLLGTLVECLNAREADYALDWPGANALAAPQGEAEARPDTLALIDSLSVVDKLKLFR
jgi:uncharacterized protein with PIN domain